MKNFEEEDKSQPKSPPTLKTEIETASEEPKISSVDQSSGAVGINFVETKLKLSALIGPLDAEHPQRPRERSRPLPAAYIEDVQDILIKHRARLEKLGIDLASEKLIEIINGHPHNLEPAIEAFFEKCAKGAIDHPERYLNAAIHGGWKAHNKSSTSIPSAAVTREFLEAYEQMCQTGAVLTIHPELLPVVSGQVNVQMLRSDCKPWEPPYDLMPWSEVVDQLVPAIATSDDEW